MNRHMRRRLEGVENHLGDVLRFQGFYAGIQRPGLLDIPEIGGMKLRLYESRAQQRYPNATVRGAKLFALSLGQGANRKLACGIHAPVEIGDPMPRH